MTISSDALTEPNLGAEATMPATMNKTRPFFWSVRRELWEYRSVTFGPVIAAAVVLFGFTFHAAHQSEYRRNALALPPAKQTMAIALPYDIAAMAIIATGLIVAAFYCLGALHNERRDRSILFWKSMPVSDLTAVLAKAAVPLAVIPLVTFGVVIVMQLLALAMSTISLIAGGMDPSTTWTRVPFLEMPLVLAYGLVVLALWYAPIWGWLLLVSAWARRAPFLWAVLPPLALAVVERIAFNTRYVGTLINYRLGGFDQAFTISQRGHDLVEPLPRMDPVGFLTTPGLWAGLAVAAAFLAAAVWLRRRREAL